MSTLTITLLGKYRIMRNEVTLSELENGKAYELLFYLLLHRDRQHPREVLADLLWGDMSPTQSRKYLRQVLWRLQSVLAGKDDHDARGILVIQPDWLGINNSAEFSLDVAVLEDTFAAVNGVPGHALDADAVSRVERAIDVYRGDLLEDWYQDWCVRERERLQHLFLTLLTKLMEYRAGQGEFEAGIAHARRLLLHDAANERAHCGLMRMYYQSGDRTAALRQYRRCAEILMAELGVEPAGSTTALYQAIRRDRDIAASDAPLSIDPIADSPLSQTVAQLQADLDGFRRRIDHLQRDLEMLSPVRSDEGAHPVSPR